MRSPRFRRVPSVRAEVFDHGGATASRISMPHMLPSPACKRLGLHDVCVFEAQYLIPHICSDALRGSRHLLPRRLCYQAAATPYLDRTFTGWNTPACPGALYASHPPSPATTQHSLRGGRYPLPRPDFHRLEHASFPWRIEYMFSGLSQIPDIVGSSGSAKSAGDHIGVEGVYGGAINFHIGFFPLKWKSGPRATWARRRFRRDFTGGRFAS
jgi:hypothetical protein